MKDLIEPRAAMRAETIATPEALERLIARAGISEEVRARAFDRAVSLVRSVRTESEPGMMEAFLLEYGLSTEEGVALMCLAEALLRVPDGETMDALIEDKIAPSEWGRHLGHSASSMVNASTWALFLTGKVLGEGTGMAGVLRGAVKRLGEPVIRQAVGRVMRELGRQFVLGETIEGAMRRAARMERQGWTYSYDMLGEAAVTARDAERYMTAYKGAIQAIAEAAAGDVRESPGISVKLSALHPRYETVKRARVMDELVPRLLHLAQMAADAGIGLNVDAEEAARLDLSLDVIEAVTSDEALKGWDGFGVVVQAYGPRASHVIAALHDMAERLDRRIMVRLVKGAYWDSEIKLAQEAGLDGFSVWSRKAETDVSYLANAARLLDLSDRIYPQFATHNAHTMAMVIEMAAERGLPHDAWEFQRLHGMGLALHETVKAREGTRHRIYAPVGAHEDLLAYLVRRLLENGANSSFVNMIVDEDVSAETVVADPFDALRGNDRVTRPADLFGERRNARGWDLTDPAVLNEIATGMAPFMDRTSGEGDREVRSPATGTLVGHVRYASPDEARAVCDEAEPWKAAGAERARILRRAADLYEEHAYELFALLTREGGKTLPDCVSELREAVDFLRYYADADVGEPAGLWVCVSPWNFPLAIFTGQVAASLRAGNATVAKPAEATSLVAQRAVELLHRAGVPEQTLRLVVGAGDIGAAVTSHARVDGVAFTGSTATAKLIDRAMANPCAPLIAETGGLNAMIVDSTALTEQAVRDIVASAFQSAGQRCSALRCLYVQEDVADRIEAMLIGAMAELAVGDPADPATDLGPVIDEAAKRRIEAHVAEHSERVLARIEVPNAGNFVAPTLIEVDGIEDLEEEVFGPILHIARFTAADLDRVIEAINATGYGLTFGLHTRIDDRVEHVSHAVDAGNIYVNRNQIGAVVGSQPFGGEGLSGTGPKAGGPRYAIRFCAEDRPMLPDSEGQSEGLKALQAAVNASAAPEFSPETVALPGPTGESNRLTVLPRGTVLCMGPDAEAQAKIARSAGCATVVMERVRPSALTEMDGIAAVAYWGDAPAPYRRALAERDGPIVPLLCGRDFGQWCVIERHVCIDTTAAGGNAALLAGN